jgi:hypothetical protein
MKLKLTTTLTMLALLAGSSRATAATWSMQQAPDAASDVSCRSARACVAVGAGAAELWNGSHWAEIGSQLAQYRLGDLVSVSCPTLNRCLAVGDGKRKAFASLWNGGSSWTRLSIRTPAGAQGDEQLRAVSCPSADSCTAVGWYTNNSGAEVTLAEHWNGSDWSIEPTPNPARSGQHLTGVSCRATTSCEAVGSYTIPARQGKATRIGALAEHWNGRRWSIQETPDPRSAPLSYLRWVSCSSANACTAVGHYYPDPRAANFPYQRHLALIERWNGHRWSIQRVPNPPDTRTSFLSSVSCPSARSCTAVGLYDQRNSRQRALAEQWDGVRWVVSDARNHHLAASNSLSGVSCALPALCTAVGISKGGSGAYGALVERYS